jgi:peptide deformylase
VTAAGPAGAPGTILVSDDRGLLVACGEGCLSVPGYYETVNRPQRIRVTALGRDGEAFTEELEGLAAICLQHEVDHLDGKLFVDYISPLKRQRIRRKLEKAQRVHA